jgi:hypothetical protein
MQQINLHKQKLYALIVALVGFIALLLPWVTVQGNTWRTGFNSWGIVSLFGIIAVIIASLMGDKTKEYEGNLKLIALGGFVAVSLGAFITLLTRNSAVGGMYRGNGGVDSGFGIWLSFIVASTGTALVSGQIKIPDKNKPPASPPPPPL